MNEEHIRTRIETALDLLQLIIEALEDDFYSSEVDGAIKKRASLSVSSLYVLSDFLRGICEK